MAWRKWQAAKINGGVAAWQHRAKAESGVNRHGVSEAAENMKNKSKRKRKMAYEKWRQNGGVGAAAAGVSEMAKRVKENIGVMAAASYKLSGEKSAKAAAYGGGAAAAGKAENNGENERKYRVAAKRHQRRNGVCGGEKSA
jgi:hypothetical protein